MRNLCCRNPSIFLCRCLCIMVYNILKRASLSPAENVRYVLFLIKMLNPAKMQLIALIWYCKSTFLPELNIKMHCAYLLRASSSFPGQVIIRYHLPDGKVAEKVNFDPCFGAVKTSQSNLLLRI